MPDTRRTNLYVTQQFYLESFLSGAAFIISEDIDVLCRLFLGLCNAKTNIEGRIRHFLT